MYLQDVHVENFVSRNKSSVVSAVRIMMIVLAVFCLFGAIFTPLALIGVIVFGILAWYLGTRSQIDFDYSYTNGTIDIARVFAKSSRKKYLSIEMKDVSLVAPLDSNYARAYQGRGLKTYDCTSRRGDHKVYEVVFHDTKSNNNSEEIILMELEDDFLDAMSTASPSIVHK